MRKFILTILGYALIICFIVVCVNRGYKSLVHDEATKFENVPEKIQICNLGSSHGLYGYNYEKICDEYTCFNFGLESQYLSYDYRILTNYQNRLKDDTVVFITVSYFSFFGEAETEEDNFDSKNQRYYKFLPRELIKQYDWSTDFYAAKCPALADYETLIRVFLGQGRETMDLWWEQTVEQDKAEGGARAAYCRHVVEGKVDAEGKRIYNWEEIEALYDIIALCKEHDAVPVLVTTPYLEEYTKAIQEGSPDFYADFYDVIDQITGDTNTLYYDYAFDKRFSHEYSLFLDSDHLNKEGAAVFVDILMEEVVSDILNAQ